MAKENVEKKEGVVQLTNEQFSEIMNRLARAEGQKTEKPKRVTEHTAKLRFHEGSPVVSYAGYKERMEDGKRVAYFEVTTLEKESVEVNYLKFLNEAPAETVKILSQKAQTSVKNYGTVKAVNPDPMNQKTWDGGMIDLEVSTNTYQAEVEVIEGEHLGQKYSVPTTVLNL